MPTKKTFKDMNNEERQEFLGRINAMPFERRVEFAKQTLAGITPTNQVRTLFLPGAENVVAREEKRADGDGVDLILEGYGAVFGEEYETSWFIETVQRGAFVTTIAEDDIRGLVNHDVNQVIGRNTAGTMDLSEDGKGLKYIIRLLDCEDNRKLHGQIKRKDISGSSFSFSPVEEIWDESGDKIRRTLITVKASDTGPVTYPAYTGTDVSARSLDKFEEENRSNSDDDNSQDDASWERQNEHAREVLDLLELEGQS